MSTLTEESTVINDSVQVQPTGTDRQNYELTDPTLLVPLPAGTLSKDQSSNSSKMETIQSFYNKWRLMRIDSITPATAVSVPILTLDVGLHTLLNYSDLGNPLNKTLKIPDSITFGDGATVQVMSYEGVKFTTEVKTTIYSSSVQQGALIFALYPVFKTNRTQLSNISVDWNRARAVNVHAASDVNIVGPTLDSRSALQVPHKIVSLGAETEVITQIPMMLKYDHIVPHRFPMSASWATYEISLFDNFRVNDAAYNKVTLRHEIRFVDVEFIGPSFDSSVTSMGNYHNTTAN